MCYKYQILRTFKLSLELIMFLFFFRKEEEFAKELITNFENLEFETLKEHFPTIDYEFYKKVKNETLPIKT